MVTHGCLVTLPLCVTVKMVTTRSGKRKVSALHAVAQMAAQGVNIGTKLYKAYNAAYNHRRAKRHRTAPDGGSGSTGDMNKVIYRKKRVSRRRVKRQKRFKRAVQKALETDSPLIKVFGQYTLSNYNPTYGQQNYGQIAIIDVPQMRNALAALTGLAASPADFSQRYELYSFILDGFYSNAGNTLAVVDWYTVVPRVDNINTPGADFLQAAGEVPGSSGEGCASGTGDALFTSAPTTQGLTPFHFSQFCCKWKIVSQRRVMLQPGETKEFRHRMVRPKTIEGARFQQGGTPYAAVKGITKYWFYIIYGQPVHDGTTETNISTAPTRVDMSYTTTMTCRPAPSLSSNATRSGQIQLITTAAYQTVTTGKVLDQFAPTAPSTSTGN